MVRKIDVLQAVESAFIDYDQKWNPEDKDDGFAGAVPEAIRNIPDVPKPALSAEEVLQWLRDHDNDGCYKAAFGKDYLMHDAIMKFSPKELVKKIAAYEKEQKILERPETEWYWECRIVEERSQYCVSKMYCPIAEFPESAEKFYQEYIQKHCSKDNSGYGYFLKVQKMCRVKEDCRG